MQLLRKRQEIDQPAGTAFGGNKMIIAVFGDVHGNLSGMYELARSWQQHNAQTIDLILQTGDLGLWSSFEQMDSATRRHYARDESELDSAAYLSARQEAAIETWFVHGNHENFELLAGSPDKAVDLGPKDPHGKIIFLAPGSVREFCKGKEIIRVAGLGGMEYRFGKYPIPSQQLVQKYLHPALLEQLRKIKQQVDVLLLHDAPLNKGLRNKFPTGSKRLTELIEELEPRFVFYGHYDDPPEPFNIGSSLCAGMNQPAAKRIPNRDGAMGILETDKWGFHFVKP